MPKLLRLPEVSTLTQRSRSRIYEDMAAGTFPKNIKIGSRAVAWIEDEVRSWIDQRVAERDAA